MSKPPLFAGDVQFWYETLRVFGADEMAGASSAKSWRRPRV